MTASRSNGRSAITDRPLARRTESEAYALVFGAFLGLALLKFGNPAVLDDSVAPPSNLAEVWNFAWPVRWAYWLLIPMAVAAVLVSVRSGLQWKAPSWLWILPLLWIVWQAVSASSTVDSKLTVQAMGCFAGCLLSYFVGASLFGSP